MICNVCGSNKWLWTRTYKGPDKYEKWCDINGPEPMRSWWNCRLCGLYKCVHSYETDLLKPIYTDGYRSENFRNESIEDAFRKVARLPLEESENAYRVRWLRKKISPTTLLDIGSGLGVFPYAMKLLGYSVHCVEPNKDSAEFIQTKLGMPCFPDFYKAEVYAPRLFGCVSLVHVLEHLSDPESVLLNVRHSMAKNGNVFVEVPDAIEFQYLSSDHDEFNSCHLYFFTPASLIRLVEASGFKVTDVHRVRHETRNLSRILLLANAEY